MGAGGDDAMGERLQRAKLLAAAAGAPLLVMSGAATAAPQVEIRFDHYLPLTEYQVGGFASELTAGSLTNPVVEEDVEVEGRQVSLRIHDVFRVVDERFGLSLFIDYSEVEGRAASIHTLPNFGIPGTGQAFGVFINQPTTAFTSANVDVWQLAFAIEGDASLYRSSFGQGATPNANMLDIRFLAGLRVDTTNTSISHSAHAISTGGVTDVSYFTDLNETSATPYLGLQADYSREVQNYVFSASISGRLGAAFSCYDGADTLFSTGLANINQQIDIGEASTNPYLSFGGAIGVRRGMFGIGLSATSEYGAIRDPNVFREDSVASPGGGFELVKTALDPEALWTHRIGANLVIDF